MDVPFSIANCWQTLSLPGTRPYQAPVIRSMVQIHMVHPHLDIGVQHPPTMEVLQPWHQLMQVPRKPRGDSLEHQGCFAGKTRQTKMCWGTCSAFSSKKPGSNDDSTYVFFPTISGNSETFLEWPSGTQARRANRTPQVFSQCQASQDQPPGYHRRPFPSPQFLAYHPQKPWVCFSINLFMSAISAPFWGGPFLFFWHWGVLKWIWQTYKTHSKCWHHWFWKFTGNHGFLPSNIGLSCKNFPSSNSMMASSKCFQQWGSKSWRAKPLIPNPLGVVDQPVEEGAWGAIEITTYHLGMNNQTWKVLYVDI